MGGQAVCPKYDQQVFGNRSRPFVGSAEQNFTCIAVSEGMTRWKLRTNIEFRKTEYKMEETNLLDRDLGLFRNVCA